MASDIRPARLGSSRRLAYAGGGSAGFRQRQTCEPGSHLGSRVRTRCNLAETCGRTLETSELEARVLALEGSAP